MKPIPPPILKAWLWFLLPVLALPVGVYSVTKGSHALLFVTLLFALAFIGQAVHFVRMQRLRRSLRAASGRLCLNCAFDLRGLGEAGLCPECGNTFDIPADQAHWRSFLSFDPR